MTAQFILLCRDRKDAGTLRADTREAHLSYIKETRDAVLLAGPMLDSDGKPEGSLLIIEAADLNAAKAFAAGDPYAKAGLFEATEIRPYRIVTGALAQS